MRCKNCGKEIMQMGSIYDFIWVHVETNNARCNNFAEHELNNREKDCEKEIEVNKIRMQCSLEYGHFGKHIFNTQTGGVIEVGDEK